MDKNKVDYKKLCHQLEANVDKAIEMLKQAPHPVSQRAAAVLREALHQNEDAIIKDYNNVILFPSCKVEVEEDFVPTTKIQ